MNMSALLNVISHAGKLKTLKRTGWKINQVPEPESVADHSFRVAFIAMLLADELNLNVTKLLKMSLIHDLAESVTGDISPHCGISPQEKHVQEKNALKEIFADVKHGDAFINLWLDYEEQKCIEARVLKNIDKLEMAIQSIEYQKRHADLDLSEFLSSADRDINISEIRSILQALMK